MLRHVPAAKDPRVLVDAATRDDAAVYRLAPDRALVATVDFFTPIVDDAYDFGRIAAANAFSDLYAMGATPLMALNLVGWPRDQLPLELLGDVLRGGNDVARAAGALILGGHSIDDPEPKYGLVALGEAQPDRIVTNAGGRAGDALVLTKPIGTGVLTTALKRDLIGASDLAAAVTAMTMLNAGAARAMLDVGVHAATDVTGFGLLGHLHELLSASGLAAVLDPSAVPVFAGVQPLVERGAVPGGTARNLSAVQAWTTFAPGVSEATRIILADAQTSGGLLLAVPAERLAALLAALARERAPETAVVGRLVAGPAGTITVA